MKQKMRLESTYLWKHAPLSVAIPDVLNKEPLYLVDENLERLFGQFVKVLIENQETIVGDALKQHPYLFYI